MEKCKFRIKLQAEACNFTKSITPPWVFFAFFHCANGTKSCKASHMRKVKKTSKSDVVANCTGSRCPSCRSIATLFIIKMISLNNHVKVIVLTTALPPWAFYFRLVELQFMSCQVEYLFNE